ncbi:hypothetical protein BGZ68_000974 [Mortierella alpina]|nr:hypothetical protein BGZ68_000974 [Mortierella alpina]
MTDTLLTLFCLVDGEATSNAFPVEIASSKTIGDFKKLIKSEIPDTFNGVDAKDLTLWSVSIPDDNLSSAITADVLSDRTQLNNPRTRLSKLFPEAPDDYTYILVQRPPPVHAPVPIRASTPLPGYLSDESRPGTPLSGDLHVDIKKITDKFFAPGPIANFLDAYVKGEGALPVTTGPIRGLPRAWRRNYGKPTESRPSLLFLDLPDPTAPDSASRNLAAGSILELVKENNRYHIPQSCVVEHGRRANRTSVGDIPSFISFFSMAN